MELLRVVPALPGSACKEMRSIMRWLLAFTVVAFASAAEVIKDKDEVHALSRDLPRRFSGRGTVEGLQSSVRDA